MANVLPYGFQDISHLVDERLINDVGVEIVEDAIRKSLDVHNQVMNSMLDLFVERTVEYKKRYMSPVHTSLQPIDPETGRARPIMAVGHYDVAWPMTWGATALAATKIALMRMTMVEGARRTMAIMEADRRWMRDHILASLFYNAAYNYADPEYGTLAIQPLANGDTVTYYKKGSADTAATDTHYFAQAAAISDDANILKTVADDLREHPENDGEVLFLAATNQEAAIMDLAQFHLKIDPNIRTGTGEDVLVGAGPGVAYPGELIGYEGYSRSWVSRWDALPAGYILGVATGGSRALRMREDPIAALRGFFLDYERINQPFWEAQYKRGCGFGSWNRVGAAVTYIGGAEYAVPTGYDKLLPG